MLLESDDPDIMRKVDMPELDVMDAATDFLRALYVLYMKVLHEMIKRWIGIPQTDFVLTIPAMWDEAASNVTVDVATYECLLEFFKLRMGSEYGMLTEQARQRTMGYFRVVKCNFSDRRDQAIYTVVPGINNLREARIENGKLMISRGEMRSLFDPVITDIITSIYNQRKELAESSGEVYVKIPIE
ncbi:hypothetical protein TWF694_010004 [Orbilia ellipsospora]|uniref:Uncharacterized protein n=1 Tax=Orbilia ellipsospora TaxID=2528407 RepID=A0AAV9X8K9_9PEZI